MHKLMTKQILFDTLTSIRKGVGSFGSSAPKKKASRSKSWEDGSFKRA